MVTLKVLASVRFLTANEGGKTSSVREIYRPVHNFGDPTNRELWFGQIALRPGDSIAPGESRELIVEFPDDPCLLQELLAGRTWRIQEGPTLVATATVLEVLIPSKE